MAATDPEKTRVPHSLAGHECVKASGQALQWRWDRQVYFCSTWGYWAFQRCVKEARATA